MTIFDERLIEALQGNIRACWQAGDRQGMEFWENILGGMVLRQRRQAAIGRYVSAILDELQAR